MRTDRRETGLAVAAAVVLLIAGALWIRQAEVIALVTQIAESVPPIPALAGLLLLVAVNAAARARSGRAVIPPGSALMVYSFLAVALAILGPGIARFLFSNLSAPLYYATEENRFGELTPHIPGWFVPKSPAIIDGFYEGSYRRVPWEAWAMPLGLWLVFFTLLWITLISMMLLVRGQWMENERLSFPQLHLPLQIAEAGETGFFRNPIMWAGFGLSAAYDLVNIAHAFVPSVPHLGMAFPLGEAFLDRPWDAIRGLTLHLRPEMIGLGYLVSLEVSFSVWFFSLALMLQGVAGRAYALDRPGFPFPQEQGIGAYIALALILAWGARQGLLRALHPAHPSLSHEERRHLRTAAVGLIGGFAGLVLWGRVAGLPVGIGALYFGLILAVALVYARIRAETGVPLIWGFPYGQQYSFILNLAGSHGLTAGGPAGLVVLTNLAFLSRGYFPALAAYPLEAMKLGEITGVSRKRVLTWMFLAVPAGLIVSYVVLLTTYYQKGAANIGLWGTWAAIPLFRQAVTLSQTATPPRWDALSASGVGAAAVYGLTLLRGWWMTCPFHPLGFAMATSYGNLFWGPFLIVWALKGLILRYGGHRLYVRLIPGFLGLALGHFFIAGVVWGACGAFFPEALPGYQVWFG
ncbi:MAG: hypothetical protein KY468_04310 [Armatimonadetes bacterium]|nr:hypothetical protein [Armatimonadota bacterium]